MLAIAGTVENLNAIWRPTYGPEKRGGTAYCDVILSDEIIGSPIVDEPEIVIAMDEHSFRQFEPAIVPGGLMLYNSSLCTSAPGREDIRYLPVPAGGLAHQMGADKSANMVLLGAAAGGGAPGFRPGGGGRAAGKAGRQQGKADRLEPQSHRTWQNMCCKTGAIISQRRYF